MSVTLLLLAIIGTIIAWWMAGQRLTSKPWLEASPVQAATAPEDPPAPAIRIGLYLFLGVAAALFSLFISAYVMRMASSDWWGMPVPRLLWVNTGLLAASSVALQWAKHQAHHGQMKHLRPALATGLLLAVLFLAGQVEAWRQLNAAGYVLADNPANSFFYLLTGLHGLHVLGGLVVTGRTAVAAFSNDVPQTQLRLRIDLCTLYGHFMLAIWLVLFALFAGWANDFVDLCRQLLSQEML
jgi:cytochrome c oxidase subunit 3